MSKRAILSFVLVWVLSLFAVAAAVKAQSYQVRPLPEPRIVSGADFGLRVEGDQNGTPVGRLVVRLDGKWIEALVGPVPGVRPAY